MNTHSLTMSPVVYLWRKRKAKISMANKENSIWSVNSIMKVHWDIKQGFKRVYKRKSYPEIGRVTLATHTINEKLRRGEKEKESKVKKLYGDWKFQMLFDLGIRATIYKSCE